MEIPNGVGSIRHGKRRIFAFGVLAQPILTLSELFFEL